MKIQIPFLKREIGAGDIVKSAASALGVEQQPDCGCARRQESMNRALTFQPRVRNPWASVEYPAVAQGWSIVAETAKARLTTDGAAWKAWRIESGQYRGSAGNGEATAREAYELWR